LVNNVAPTVEAGGPYTGQVGRPVSLAGTALDASTVDQTSLFYRWDFGDGTQGSGPVVSHTYAQSGTYTVTLKVRDKDGAEGIDTAVVQISKVNQAPQAIIEGPISALVGETLNFSGSNSSDLDGSIVSYFWNFGNEGTGSGVNVTYSFDAPGNYKVTLTVIDNDGLSATQSQSVQVNQPAPVLTPPTAVISNSVTIPVVGQPVEFDAGGSGDSDGTIVSYAWDFGDNNTASGVTVSHTYNQAGSYTVRLIVTDNDNLSTETTLLVEVVEELEN